MFEYAIYGPWNHTHNETETEWGHIIQENTLFLFFQGSTSPLDWKQNFKAYQVPYRDMPHNFTVHEGFLLKWKAIKDTVLSYITDDIQNIVISGYSQGAAIATIAHEYIWYNYSRSLKTYTFGSPRVFDFRVPQERFKNLLRVTHANDIVTKMPFAWMFYTHVGEHRHVGKMSWPFIMSVKDHDYNEYAKYM